VLTFTTISDTRNCLSELKKEGKTIGFVPTMGALHSGHISLINQSNRENSITASSIFVNPLQFNDKKDLDKYPRTLENDSLMLKTANCGLLFAPSVYDMYPEGSKTENDLLELRVLDKVMEGKYRPGHFQGVCRAVKRLFDIIQPDTAYFGEKDFQQVAIIEYMVREFKLPIKIVRCATVREQDGLAMSSRNVLLSPAERKNASIIYSTLLAAKENKKTLSVSELVNWATEQINTDPLFQVEYFEIVNAETLESITDWSQSNNIRGCIAVKAGNVRLIDNIQF